MEMGVVIALLLVFLVLVIMAFMPARKEKTTGK